MTNTTIINGGTHVKRGDMRSGVMRRRKVKKSRKRHAHNKDGMDTRGGASDGRARFTTTDGPSPSSGTPGHNQKNRKRPSPGISSAASQQSHDRSNANNNGSATTAPKRIKEKPVRFTHPQLDAEVRRLGRPWLSPGDPLFGAAMACSYRGLVHVPAESVPASAHKGFRHAFDSLHEAGLFLYDTVQAGGRRLSRTFVTRTLVGDAGITYKYLGLRLFAHPWDDDAESDHRVGPGDSLADSLNDPCLADLWGGADSESTATSSSGSSRKRGKQDSDLGNTLRKVGHLSNWMRERAAALLKAKSRVGSERDVAQNYATSRSAGEAAAGVEKGRDVSPQKAGSCEFNLTLINRMECSSAKRDLKPDPLFAMGKCSVSWHADSCLDDFSTIGVYHCTEPVSLEPDWGIAVRVSQEAESDGSGETGPKVAKLARARNGVTVVVATEGGSPVGSQGGSDVSTPPLLLPLQSGDAYFLLDDFNHFHEHAVVSGSSTLRYSSTHRVAATDRNTFPNLQERCEAVLADSSVAEYDPRQVLILPQVRAEQELLSELEFEWLNQFWVQGRRHAVLHSWWRGPMALVLATWRELERRTAINVRQLLSLPNQQQRVAEGAEPGAISRAFEAVLRALEERKESRTRWDSRFKDSAYRSLAVDCAPVVPKLWSSDSTAASISTVVSDTSWDTEGTAHLPLPKGLEGVIARLRECFKEAYRAASGGMKAGSGKAIAAGAASNWELFCATSTGSSDAAASSPLSAVSHAAATAVSSSRTTSKINKKGKQSSRPRETPQRTQQHQQQQQQQVVGLAPGGMGRWSSGKATKRGNGKGDRKGRR